REDGLQDEHRCEEVEDPHKMFEAVILSSRSRLEQTQFYCPQYPRHNSYRGLQELLSALFLPADFRHLRYELAHFFRQDFGRGVRASVVVDEFVFRPTRRVGEAKAS